MATNVREQLKAMMSIKYDRQVIKNAPDLKVGDAHPSLIEVQNYLKRYGYLAQNAKVTPGRLDAMTVQALQEYQRRFNIGTSGTMDAPTLEAMFSARCGLPDVLLEFSTRCRWNRRNLTYAFATLTDQVGNDIARRAVRRAFDSWAAAGVGLTFTEVAQGEDPDISIDWRAAADPDSSMVGTTLAHADFPPGCSIIVSNLPLPLHFDDEEHAWVDGAVEDGFDIETVALHEIGHCLGLMHTDVSGSVMFPTVSDNFTLRILQPDDLAGIRNLYPSNRESLGGEATSDPGAVLQTGGRLVVFVRGTDNNIWHRWQQTRNGEWSDWESIASPPGGATSGPDAALNDPGGLVVFVRGADNAIWHTWQGRPDSEWSGWESLGGEATSDPGAVLQTGGRLVVFVRGTDNNIWHRWQVSRNGGWSGWEPIPIDSAPGGATSGPDAALNDRGGLVVFVRGADNAIWHAWQGQPNGGWWATMPTLFRD